MTSYVYTGNIENSKHVNTMNTGSQPVDIESGAGGVCGAGSQPIRNALSPVQRVRWIGRKGIARVAKCGRTYDTKKGPVTFYCALANRCQKCSKHEWHQKKLRILNDLQSFATGSGTMLLVTLNVPHTRKSDVRELTEQALKQTSHVLSSYAANKLEHGYGYVGRWTRLEIASTKEGLAPHTHSVLFFERMLTANEVDEISDILGTRARKAYPGTKQTALFDLEQIEPGIRSAIKIAGYMTKPTWRVSMQIARETTRYWQVGNAKISAMLEALDGRQNLRRSFRRS